MRYALIAMVLFVAGGARLPIPTPRFRKLPMPNFQTHTGKVIVKPTVLTHTKHTGCQCPMCRGVCPVPTRGRLFPRLLGRWR